MERASKLALAICLTCLCLSNASLVSAFSLANTPSTANFTTAHWRLSHESLTGGILERGSPTLADLSGDGVPEVIIGTTAQNGTGGYNRDTILAVMKWNGTSGTDNMGIWWAVDVDAPINSTPAVGDLEGDGDPEVVVSLGGDVNDLNHHGGIKVYNSSGTMKWFFSTHNYLNQDSYADGVFSSPTLCDVDADGDLEIAFGGWDQRIYLLDHDGNSLWNTPGWGNGYFVQDTVWSTAACADLNQDGFKEIIIGGDMTGGGTLLDGTYTQDGGLIYIFDKDGNLLVRRYLPEAIYAAPAVGDLDGDGHLEIVSGTSWVWWDTHGRTDQPYVYVFDTDNVFNASMAYSDPNKLPHASGWPQPTDYPGFSSPAIADLDEDGDLEIIIGSGDPYLNIGDSIVGEGKVYAWHHNGQPVDGWPIEPKDMWSQNDTYISSSPTIADVDADGGLEILFSMVWSVHVYNADGTPQALIQDGQPHTALLYAEQMLTTVLWGSPAVGDADDDGKPEIWIGGAYRYDTSVGHLWRFESESAGTENAPWPMFHHDPLNTGFYAPPGLGVNPDTLLILHEYGSGSEVNTTLSIVNTGEGEIQWEATPPPDVTLGSLSGTVDGLGESIPVTITVSGYLTGTHDLGTIELTATANGEEVKGSPTEIPVTLYVGPVHRTYLPTVLK